MPCQKKVEKEIKKRRVIIRGEKFEAKTGIFCGQGKTERSANYGSISYKKRKEEKIR